MLKKERQMKVCTRCRIAKPLNDFPPNKRHTDGKASICRTCHVNYGRTVKGKIGKRNCSRKTYIKNKCELDNIKLRSRCTFCGYNYDCRLLVFHHVMGEKKYDLSQILKYSDDVINDELSKCIVICRSCHKLQHDE